MVCRGYKFLDDVDYLVVVVPCFVYDDSSLSERKYALTP